MLRAAVLACLSLLASFAFAQPSQSFVHTQGSQIVSADGMPLHLRGINVGNWFVPEGYMWHFDGGPQSPREIQAFVEEMIGPTAAEKFWQTWRDQYITQQDIHRIRQQGFNSIRVPIDFRLFAAKDSPGWAMLDHIVAWSHAEGLLVVIDMHAAPGGQTGANIDDSYGWPWLFADEGAQQQTIALWQQIARRYAANPTVLGYDLLNEPLPHFPQARAFDAKLEPFYKRLARAIRQVDTHHILILEAAKWDSDFSVFSPPFDQNVVYEFHFYSFGSSTTPTKTAIQSYLDFRDRYKVPLWLGESGENTDAWVQGTRELVEGQDIGWAFWPYKKMDSPRSPVTFAQPANWADITSYAKGDRGLGNIEERWKHRPDQPEIDRAFADLLHQITYPQEQVNAGYVKALLPQTQP